MSDGVTSAGRLAGRRVLVTGAGSGIGRGIAIRLAADGAAVGCLDRNADAVHEVVAQLERAGAPASALVADVSREDAVIAAVAQCVQRWGGLDGVVSNAGVELIGRDAAVDELDLDVWQQTIDVNLTGAFLVGKHGARALLDSGGGAMVFTGSPTGLFGFAVGENAYSASKAGVHGLARVMAAEYAQRGIRVNIVVPGLIDTPPNAALLAAPDELTQFLTTVPLRRPGQPAEVAGMVSWLLSDEASYCTGGFFMVDGGATAV